MRELIRRIHYLINRRRLDADLASDMEFHREMAANQGRNNFGNTLRLREQAREAWGWTWLDRAGQDLRYGVRILARSPGFTLVAVLVLAIGVGVNAAAFSLFDMVALQPLPVRDPGTLVRLERRSPENSTDAMPYPSLQFYQRNASRLAAVMGVLGVPPMQFEHDVQPVSASFYTANYFAELGTVPAVGRLLDAARDGEASDAPVVVLSYGFWQRRFDGDPAVIGTTVHIQGKPLTVAGVTPYAFANLGGQDPDLMLPIAQQPYVIEGSHVLTDSSVGSLRMWGRLAPGVSPQAAAQQLKSLTSELRRQHPKDIWDNEFIHIAPGGHLQVMGPDLVGIAAMVGVLTLLILVVACANLGGLMLARAVTRTHEMGIRIAIGAGRGRIFRQLLTESLLLASLGSAAGLLLGYIWLRVALRALDAPKWLNPMPDWRVLAFAGCVTVASAVFFGLAPALQMARQRQQRTLARQLLVAAQVAASCMLLIVAGLLTRATQHALSTDPGFGYQQLTSIDPQLDRHGYTAATAQAYLDQMRSRLEATPGVLTVALVHYPPLGHSQATFVVESAGHSATVYPNSVDPHFFFAMHIPLVLGRTFLPGEKNAVIVSQSFANRMMPGEDPIGRKVADASKDIVVGVVGNAHINAITDDDATEEYWAVQPDDMPNLTLMVRSAGDGNAVPAAAKAISQSLDARLFPEIRSIQDLYRKQVSLVEQIALTVSIIALVAVLLAGIGIIGLVAFTVSQRTKEIAIRVALGAKRGQVLAAVLRQFLWPVALGLTAGAGTAAAASRLLRRILFGISNFDPAGYGMAICVLLGIVALAALLPARRALRLDLAKTLHYE